MHSLFKSLARRALVAVVWPLRRLPGLRLPERVFRHLHFVGPFQLVLPGGRQVTVLSWGHRVENELAWAGWTGHEPEARRLWARMVARGGDCLDVGANTATFAVMAKALSPDARVVAFEPLDRVAQLARDNAQVSGLAFGVETLAIGAADGVAKIYDPGGGNAYSASLDPTFLAGPKTSVDVAVRSLDSYCTQHGLRPKSIKIDVEGFEAEVLRGATGVLAQARCHILCEWRGNSAGHAQAAATLRAAGYVALDISGFEPVDLHGTADHAERNILLLPAADAKIYGCNPGRAEAG